jgi:hypothetical protein
LFTWKFNAVCLLFKAFVLVDHECTLKEFPITN